MVLINNKQYKLLKNDFKKRFVCFCVLFKTNLLLFHYIILENALKTKMGFHLKK
jgi:hypothetical protein